MQWFAGSLTAHAYSQESGEKPELLQICGLFALVCFWLAL